MNPARPWSPLRLLLARHWLFALGAAVGQPDRQVVLIAGDGGFLLNIAELSTAAQYGLKLAALVFNDQGYGVLRNHQLNTFEGRHIAVDMAPIDFAGVATAMGAPGRKVTTKGRLRRRAGLGAGTSGPGGTGHQHGRHRPHAGAVRRRFAAAGAALARVPFTLRSIHAREAFDARGWPTLTAKGTLDNGVAVRAVPPGSQWEHHYGALQLRDRDYTRLRGRGVLQAVRAVNETIAPQVLGRSFNHQAELDALLATLDPTPDRSELGANALLTVSILGAEAGAAIASEPLWRYLNPDATVMPRPIFDLLSGGMAATPGLDFRSYQVIPLTATSYRQALEQGLAIKQALQDVMTLKQVAAAAGGGRRVRRGPARQPRRAGRAAPGHRAGAPATGPGCGPRPGPARHRAL